MRLLTRGLLPLFILSEAEVSPTSGKRVAKALERLTKGGWRPSPGSLYPILRGLEARKLLASRLGEGGGRREIFYSITVAGKKALARGRRGLVEAANERFRVIMPVAFRITLGAGGEELEESLVEMASALGDVRAHLISLPAEKRVRALKRAILGYRKLLAELREL